VLGFTRGHAPLATLQLACAVGAATATTRGAGRNVARANKVASLLQERAALDGGHGPAADALAVLRASLAATPAGAAAAL